MVWGCITADGVGRLIRISTTMTGVLYTEILTEGLLPTISDYGLDAKDIVFQQDNDLKHTCKRVQKWFDTQGIEVLQWPAQSPDLNLIEHLWFYLKNRVRDYKNQQEEKKSFGRGLRWNGKRFLKKSVKN